MFDIKRKTIEWGGKTLVLETGRIARQADGAVLATMPRQTRQKAIQVLASGIGELLGEATCTSVRGQG